MIEFKNFSYFGRLVKIINGYSTSNEENNTVNLVGSIGIAINSVNPSHPENTDLYVLFEDASVKRVSFPGTTITSIDATRQVEAIFVESDVDEPQKGKFVKITKGYADYRNKVGVILRNVLHKVYHVRMFDGAVVNPFTPEREDAECEYIDISEVFNDFISSELREGVKVKITGDENILLHNGIEIETVRRKLGTDFRDLIFTVSSCWTNSNNESFIKLAEDDTYAYRSDSFTIVDPNSESESYSPRRRTPVADVRVGNLVKIIADKNDLVDAGIFNVICDVTGTNYKEHLFLVTEEIGFIVRKFKLQSAITGKILDVNLRKRQLEIVPDRGFPKAGDWVVVVDSPGFRKRWNHAPNAINFMFQIPDEYRGSVITEETIYTDGPNTHSINYGVKDLRFATPDEILSKRSKSLDGFEKEFKPNIPNYTGYKKEILDCILHTPEKISILKAESTNRKYFDKVINQLLPFKVGIEVECLKSLTRELALEKNTSLVNFGFKEVNKILKAVDFSDDMILDPNHVNEHRLCFNGHKQVISVQRFFALLTQYCVLDTRGGIHYHFDMPEIMHMNRAKLVELKQHFTKYLNDLNTICDYKGHYNTKSVGIDTKGTWINLRSNLNTVEIRIASPKFDYEQVITEIILISQLITKVRREMKMKEYKL